MLHHLDERLDRSERHADERFAALAKDLAIQAGRIDAVMRATAEMREVQSRILERLARLATEVGETRGRVSQLPTIWHMLNALLGFAVALSAMVFTTARAAR